jgi:hypothetical protein
MRFGGQSQMYDSDAYLSEAVPMGISEPVFHLDDADQGTAGRASPHELRQGMSILLSVNMGPNDGELMGSWAKHDDAAVPAAIWSSLFPSGRKVGRNSGHCGVYVAIRWQYHCSNLKITLLDRVF